MVANWKHEILQFAHHMLLGIVFEDDKKQVMVGKSQHVIFFNVPTICFRKRKTSNGWQIETTYVSSICPH